MTQPHDHDQQIPLHPPHSDPALNPWCPWFDSVNLAQQILCQAMSHSNFLIDEEWLVLIINDALKTGYQMGYSQASLDKSRIDKILKVLGEK